MDKIIVEFDKVLRTLFCSASTVRDMPGSELPEPELSEAEKQHAGGLMRVNHVGEICAQALYQGQAITCRTPEVRKALEQAGREETEHLAWTERRIEALGARKSLLNPFWYAGALSFGRATPALGPRTASDRANAAVVARRTENRPRHPDTSARRWLDRGAPRPGWHRGPIAA